MGDLTDWNHVVSSGTAAPPHYGEPRHEFTALRTSAAVSPLTHFALLRFHGRDANAFLQGQLTCDLDKLTDAHARFGGYCTPKGRLLASFLIWSTPQAYLMLLPADIAPGVAERLRKFVLRSQVKIEHRRDKPGPAGVKRLADTFMNRVAVSELCCIAKQPQHPDRIHSTGIVDVIHPDDIGRHGKEKNVE